MWLAARHQSTHDWKLRKQPVRPASATADPADEPPKVASVKNLWRIAEKVRTPAHVTFCLHMLSVCRYWHFLFLHDTPH